MVKKSPLILSISLLMVTSGCWKGKKGTVEGGPTCEESLEAERLSIFDEEERAFILEDSKNPFTPEGSIQLVEGDSLWEKEQQAFEPVYFEFDQYVITPEQMGSLKRTLQQIKQEMGDQDMLVIEGHSCNCAGSAEYNVMLSEKRALEAKKVFLANGFDEGRIKTVGRGFEMRKVDAGNREQQASNRRVEFYLVRRNTK